MRRSTPAPRTGPFITVEGPELAVETCDRRLSRLGLSTTSRQPDRSSGLHCILSWYGAGPDERNAGSEATVQAISGLMHLNGRDRSEPRRLGLEVASVAAGMLAAQGALAALIARSRGNAVDTVESSVLQGALLLTSHYVAQATCAQGRGPAEEPAVGTRAPPFPTADGHWVELEALEPQGWKAFWKGLGMGDASMADGWYPFVSRYLTASCVLPIEFSQTTARRSLNDLADLAVVSGVSLCRVRSYDEVLIDPELESLAAAGSVTLPATDPLVANARQGRSSHALPLEGIRVVEATSRVQGPLAGLLLRMLGCDVTRVEPPGGDVARMVPPLADGTGVVFLAFNRGKRPVELDLSRAAGRRALRELLAETDVFIHNWKPGKASAWGLASDSLARVNRRLIYCHAAGWGPAASSCPPVATDFLVQAHVGFGEGLNPEEEDPFPCRLILADFVGGLVACEAVLAGLLSREQTGHGCVVETSLVAGAMALQAHVLEALKAGREIGRREGRPVWCPLDRPVMAADGLVVVDAKEQAAFSRLCDLCGIGSNLGRSEAEKRILEHMAPWAAARCAELLLASGIPSARVCTDLSNLPADYQAKHLLEPIGGSWLPRPPWRFGHDR